MSDPEPLASIEYWEYVNRTRSTISPMPTWRSRVRYRLTRRVHSHLNLVRTHIQDQYLPRQGKIVEIGCAPGWTLLEISTRYGLEPFGIEYTESGYRATVDNFNSRNVDPSGVIFGDLTDPEFRHRYQKHFDVVFSNGLIEHFANPIDIVDHHIELLKPGGQLVVSIPNLRPFLYRSMMSITAPDILAAHNLDIMELSKFRTLFPDYRLCTHYCNYAGTFELPFVFHPQNHIARKILSIVRTMFDILLINILKHRSLSSSFTSPCLLYIGTKRDDSI